MSWINAALVLIPTALLFVQGVLCVKPDALPFVWGSSNVKKPQAPIYVWWFGWLSILLSILGLPLYVLLSSGALVLSPEFGLLMVEGDYVNRFCLGLLIIGIAIGAGMSLQVLRSLADRKSRAPWLLSIGGAVGVTAAGRVFYLSAGSVDVDAGKRVLSVTADSEQWWSMLSRLFHAVVPASLTPPATELLPIYAYDLWWPPLLIWLCICLVESAASVARLRSPPVRWSLVTFSLAALAFFALCQPELADPWSHWIWQRCLWIALPAAVVSAASLIFKLLVIGRVANQADDTVKQTRSLKFLLLAFVILGAGAAGLFYFENYSAVLLALVICGWILLVKEIRTPEPLGSPLPRNESKSADAKPGTFWSIKFKNFESKHYVELAAFVFGTYIAVTTVFLILAYELPHTGGTVIESFKSLPTEEEDVNLSKEVSDHLISTLGVLEEELQPEVITKVKKLKFGSSIDSSGAIAALAANSDFKFPGIDIPVSALLSPVEPLARTLLSVRDIHGTVYFHNSRYTVTATSNDQVWEVTEPATEPKVPGGRSNKRHPVHTKLKLAIRLAEELAFKITSTDPALIDTGITHSWKAFQPFEKGLSSWQKFNDEQDYSALSDAIDNFRDAIRIDPKFALAYYRLGLALQQDGQPATAVDVLRKSLEVNPNFIDGRIALAAALASSDPYYFKPTMAFEPTAALRTRPISKLSQAEISTLWEQVVIDPRAPVLDRAWAYYGLCRVTKPPFEHRSDEGVRDKPLSTRARKPSDVGLTSSYAAYYYCKRAEWELAKLPQDQQVDPTIRKLKASILQQQGSVLIDALSDAPSMNKRGSEGKHRQKKSEKDWLCSAGRIADEHTYDGGTNIREIKDSTYLAEAAEYFNRAEVAAPDDPGIRCDVATAAYALHDSEPMEKLENDPAQHLSLAREYSWVAQNHTFELDLKEAANNYRRALREYAKAVTLDPNNIDALQGYANTYEAWRLNADSLRRLELPANKRLILPNGDMALEADEYARSAVRLTKSIGTLNAEVEARTVLAGILLLQGRADKAVKQLRVILEPCRKSQPCGKSQPSKAQCDKVGEKRVLKKRFSHPKFHDAQWTLAAAHLCSARSSLDSAADQSPNSVQLLKGILHAEHARETQPFTDAMLLHPRWNPLGCERDPRLRKKDAPELVGPTYFLTSNKPDCGPNKYAETSNDLWLRVWGDGANRWIRASEPADDAPSLIYTVQDEDDEQFVQLYDVKRKQPVSRIYPASALAPESDRECARDSHLMLTFEQSASTDVASMETGDSSKSGVRDNEHR